MRRVLVRPEGQADWQRTEEASFKDEAHLQQLLYENPGLIPFADLGEDVPEPRAFVREAGLPGSGYTDLIGVDEGGGITVIECKLATNQEQKRKVVGQVLEYAAFLWEMSYDRFEKLFEKEYVRAGKPDLAELVAPDGDTEWSEEDFRGSISANLERGEFCLMVAVDRLNDELRRTIEYLNRRPDSGTALYAVETGYFVGEGYEVLSPRLIGPTTKPPPPPDGWNKERFFEVASRRCSAEAVALLQRLYELTSAESDRLVWGKGRVDGSFTFRIERAGVKASVFNVLTSGSLLLGFEFIQTHLGSEASDRFADDLARLDGFAGLKARLQTTKWPSYKVGDLFPEPGSLEAFEQAVRDLRDGVGK